MRSLPTSRLRSALRVMACAAFLLPLAACDSGGDGDDNGDTMPPTILSASSSDGSTVSVTFSEALDAASVTASAFTVTPGATVTAATANGASVTLTLAAGLDDDERRTYTVTANGVRDAAGNAATGASATFSFGQGGGSSGGTAVGAAYPNAGDSRIVFFNTSGDRFLVFNPVTGVSTDPDDLDDIENGLIPLDDVAAAASVFDEGETYFFANDGDTFTNYERDTADFDTPASFEEEYDEQGYELSSIGAAVEGDFFASNSIVLFNQNGTEWQLWQPENDSFSDVFTFPSQFGGGNAPISAVGAAVYREDTNQVYLFSRDGTRYTIWAGGNNFTAAFPVEELGDYAF
ncbi:MAG: Ig-like domain-containing protein [Rhodothermales bacterium]